MTHKRSKIETKSLSKTESKAGRQNNEQKSEKVRKKAFKMRSKMVPKSHVFKNLRPAVRNLQPAVRNLRPAVRNLSPFWLPETQKEAKMDQNGSQMDTQMASWSRNFGNSRSS